MSHPTTDSDEAYISPPVQRAARLLRHIADGDPVNNMAETARKLGINRTTLLRLLRTLEAERFIEPRGDKNPGWRLGIGLIGMAAQAFFSDDIVRVTAPVLTRLAETLGLSAHLGVLDGLEIVYLLRRTPNLSFASNIRAGSRLPAHATNMGRIILAHMPPEKVASLYKNVVMTPVTPQTAVHIDALQAKLDDDRAAGMAWSEGQYEAGISSVAAVVLDATGAPVAALNVSGQSSAFKGEKRKAEIARAIVDAAQEISLHLGWRSGARQNTETPIVKAMA